MTRFLLQAFFLSLSLCAFAEAQTDSSSRLNLSTVTDGPYVLWEDATTAEVLMFAKGKLVGEVFSDLAKPREVTLPGGSGLKLLLDPTPPRTPKSVWPAPSRLLAISDLEGNYSNALRFLQNNKVVDPEGHWIWGDGHLVLVGDLVDRGAQVTELMWLLRRLEREAAAAGGMTHYILGNHEAMVMGGDLRYVHDKYHYVTERMGITYDQLHGPQSDIGRWWRSKNGVEVIGNLLFVHGGYSPSLDKSQLSPAVLNKRIREGLAPAQPTGRTVATNPVLHPDGPFWYRGYFEGHAVAWGGKAPIADVNKILKRHKADRIVVGHTVVDRVGPVDASGTVIGIDVKWASPTGGEGLLSEDGRLFRLTMSGKREALRSGQRSRK